MDLIVPSEGQSYEEITVSNAAIGFTTALIQPSGASPPRGAVLTLETANIRWRVDGGDPSGAVGHLMTTTDSLVIHGANNMSNFRAFRDAGADGSLHVTYMFS